MLTHETINLIRLMVSISCLYAMCRDQELVNELGELVMQFKKFEALLKERERGIYMYEEFLLAGRHLLDVYRGHEQT